MTWMGTVSFSMSSYYNFTDFNREGANIQYIHDQLVANGYVINLPYPVETVTHTAFPTVSRINNLRANILEIINNFYKPLGVPDIVINPTRKQIFDFNEANKLELNLQGIYDVLQNVISSYKYCGTFNCGEEAIV